jgi:NAD(P)H-dependent flavin oxidoreductase YrpB (nitropropane dioxygenase family)
MTLQLPLPIIQAPMAGVQVSALAVAVSVGVVEAARARHFEHESDAAYFRKFLDEAIDQLQHGFFGEKDRDA